MKKSILKTIAFLTVFVSTVFAQDLYFPGNTFTIETEEGLKGVFVGDRNEEHEPESLSQSVYGNLRNSLGEEYTDDWRTVKKVIDDDDVSIDTAINLYTSITNLNRLWHALGIYTKSEAQPKELQAGPTEATTEETPQTPPFNNFVQPVAQYVGYTFPANEKRIINTGTDGNYGHMTFIGTGKVTDENTPSDTRHAPYNSTASRCFDFKTTPGMTGNGANAAMSMSPYYNPVGKAKKFTIMAWVYRGRLDGGTDGETTEDDNTASRIIADSPGSNGENGFDIRFSGSDGKIQVRINNEILTASGTSGGADFGIKPNDRTWRHITIWFDGTKSSGERISCYKGTKSGNSLSLQQITTGANKQSQTATEVPLNNISLYIGNSGGANTYVGNLNGYIDDVLVFKDWTPEDCGTDKLAAIRYWATNDDTTIIVPDIYESEPLGLINPDKKFYTADQIETRLQDFSIDRYLRISHIDENNVSHITDSTEFSGDMTIHNLELVSEDGSITIGKRGSENFVGTNSIAIGPPATKIRTVNVDVESINEQHHNILTITIANTYKINKYDNIDISVKSGGYHTYIITNIVHAHDNSWQITLDKDIIDYDNIEDITDINARLHNINSVIASGKFSHAEGNGAIADNDYSIALGKLAVSSNDYAYVWSGTGTSDHYGSHGNGSYNINPADGLAGFWIGANNLSNSINEMAGNIVTNIFEGKTIIISNTIHEIVLTNNVLTNAGKCVFGIPFTEHPVEYSQARNNNQWDALTLWAHPEKVTSKMGHHSVSFGNMSNVSESNNNLAYGDESFTHGGGENSAYGVGSHSEGFRSRSIGDYSHAEGRHLCTVGTASHAEGDGTLAFGTASHAEGHADQNLILYNKTYVAEETPFKFNFSSVTNGKSTFNSSSAKLIPGQIVAIVNSDNLYQIISKDNNQYTVEGSITIDESDNHISINADGTISGYGAVIFGTSVGYGSHSEGAYTVASGEASHTEGFFAIATNDYSYVYNGVVPNKSVKNITTDDMYFSHGNGTFNINPTDGIDGFWIAEHPLSWYLTDTIPLNIIYYSEDLNHEYTAITSGKRDEGFDVGPYSINIGTNNLNNPSRHTTANWTEGNNLTIYPVDENITNITGIITTTYNGTDSITFSPEQNSGFHVGDILVVTNTSIHEDVDGIVTAIGANGSLKSLVMGIRPTAAAGKYSIAIGQSVLAMADFSIALGQYSSTYGIGSVAIGGDCFAYGENSSVKGNHSTAFGKYSIVEGDNCTASGESSYAGGGYSHALADYARAVGDHAIASNVYSQASGQYVKATNDYAFVWNGAGLVSRDGVLPKSTSPNNFEDLDQYYGSHGSGTFNVNPSGDFSGFYVGENCLAEYIGIYSNKPSASESPLTINLKNGAVQCFEQPDGSSTSTFTLVLPSTPNNMTVAKLTIYIDNRDSSKRKFIIAGNNLKSTTIAQPWLSDTDSAVFKLEFTAVPFDNKWHYNGSEKYSI